MSVPSSVYSRSSGINGAIPAGVPGRLPGVPAATSNEDAFEGVSTDVDATLDYKPYKPSAKDIDAAKKTNGKRSNEELKLITELKTTIMQGMVGYMTISGLRTAENNPKIDSLLTMMKLDFHKLDRWPSNATGNLQRWLDIAKDFAKNAQTILASNKERGLTALGSVLPVGRVPFAMGGLKDQVRLVGDIVKASFAGIKEIGGFRTQGTVGGEGSHRHGEAIDIMLTQNKSQEGRSIANWLVANADELGVYYVIFDNQIWTKGRPYWRHYNIIKGRPNNATQRHEDHVHASFFRHPSDYQVAVARQLHAQVMASAGRPDSTRNVA